VLLAAILLISLPGSAGAITILFIDRNVNISSFDFFSSFNSLSIYSDFFDKFTFSFCQDLE